MSSDHRCAWKSGFCWSWRWSCSSFCRLQPKHRILKPIHPLEYQIFYVHPFRPFHIILSQYRLNSKCLRHYQALNYFFERQANPSFTDYWTLDFVLWSGHLSWLTWRLPFSHLFWSIKRIYHRHKRAISAEKKEESKKVMLYRGFKINEKELKRIRKSLNGYVQIEGFLSTTQSICCWFVRQERQNGDRSASGKLRRCTTMGSLTFPATHFTVWRKRSWSTLLMRSRSFLFTQLPIMTIWSSIQLFWNMGA